MRSPFSRGALVVLILISLPLAARVRAVRSAPPDDSPGGWLRQRAIALDDVTRFLTMTKDARVIAFGDVTHGTHETYSARFTAAGGDDWAAVLDEAGLPSMIVPLASPLPPWLQVPRRMRFAASTGPTLVTPPSGLARKFDAVLYLRTSTPSLVRHIPLFRVVQLALSQ